MNQNNEEFAKELRKYILDGKQILENKNQPNLNVKKFEEIETEFKFWVEEVSEFLKFSFEPKENEFYEEFKNAGNFNIKAILQA